MPLKDETEPITDDEWLYRRVHATRFRTARTPFVSPGAFEPIIKGNYPDIDGISLFRADCLSSAEDVLASISDPKKRKANGVVKLQVSELKSLGLSVEFTPDDTIRGHVSIPELSADAFVEERARCKELMNKLAEMASPEERIVVEPDPLNRRE